MPEPVSEDDRLEALRQRWERDPGSRIFLQLAEEYRRHGRLADAVQTLEKGLAAQPGYLSARVALGRCRLELGDPAGARQVLETVLSADPTQLVANKLLIESYLRTGDPEKARDRLDLYMLLNESDPEIETIERRILALERTTSQPFAAPEPAQAPVPADLVTPAVPLAQIEERPVPASASAAPPVVPAAGAPLRDEPIALPALELGALDLAGIPIPRGARRAVTGARPLKAPFPALFRAADLRLVADGIAAGGIFRRRRPARVAVEAPEASAEPTPPTVAPAVEAFELGAETLGAAVLPAPPAEPELAVEIVPESPLDLIQEAPAVEAPPAPIALVEPVVVAESAAERPPEVEEPAPSPWWKIPAPREEHASAEIGGRDLAPAGPAALAAGNEPLDQAPSPPPLETGEAGSVSTAAAPMPPTEVTATLGDLYLQQGHLEEAEKAFRSVLSRDPGHHGATAGLDEVSRRRRDVDTGELLGLGEPTGLTARKIRVLQSYLERIREGARRHVS